MKDLTPAPAWPRLPDPGSCGSCIVAASRLAWRWSCT